MTTHIYVVAETDSSIDWLVTIKTRSSYAVNQYRFYS